MKKPLIFRKVKKDWGVIWSANKRFIIVETAEKTYTLNDLTRKPKRSMFVGLYETLKIAKEKANKIYED